MVEVTYDTEGGFIQNVTINTIVQTLHHTPRVVRRGGGGGRNRRRRRTTPSRTQVSNARRAAARRRSKGRSRGRRGGRDPLAQSFTVDGTGMNLTSVDLFFAKKIQLKN